MMQLCTDNIEGILEKISFARVEKYGDEQLNKCYNYWCCLQENEEQIVAECGVALESILYGKYYWFFRLKERFHEVNGVDAGIEQQLFLLLEELEHRLGAVNWELIEAL